MNEKPALSRFFLAIVPPLSIQDYASNLMKLLSDRYQMRASNAPPHITIYAPFQWGMDQYLSLDAALQAFVTGQSVVPIRLSGFGAFKPRVLYVHVEKTPELMSLQSQLLDHLEENLGLVDPVARRRPFTPHLTLASRNVTRKTFAAAWDDLQPHAAEFEFEGDRLILLHHRGDRWHIHSEYSFQSTS